MAREYEGHRPEAEEMSADALAVAERVRDPGALIAALQARQMVRSGPDGIAQREGLGTRMLELSRAGAGPMAALWGHLWRADVGLQRGDIDAAVAELDELIPVVEAVREPLARWHLLRARSVIAALRGDFAAGLGLAADARRLGRRGQHPPAEQFYYVFVLSLGRLTGDLGNAIDQMEAEPDRGLRSGSALLALAHLDLGHTDRARQWYQNAPGLDFARVPRSFLLPFAAYWGELAARLDDPPRAAEVFEWLRPYARLFVSGGAGTAFNFGSASRYLGLLATSMHRWDDAAAYFVQAIADNTAARALPSTALAQVDYAEMLQRRGVSADRTRARALAEPARRIAEQLGMRSLLDRLVILERALGAAPPHPLSRREVEVAALVAGGLTSRQIAAALHLSERTAEHHVDSIRTKLGFASRSQIAGWAVANGIADSTKLGS
jgi:DNA-binding CsgD family transcriptional regulator